MSTIIGKKRHGDREMTWGQKRTFFFLAVEDSRV